MLLTLRRSLSLRVGLGSAKIPSFKELWEPKRSEKAELTEIESLKDWANSSKETDVFWDQRRVLFQVLIVDLAGAGVFGLVFGLVSATFFGWAGVDGVVFGLVSTSFFGWTGADFLVFSSFFDSSWTGDSTKGRTIGSFVFLSSSSFLEVFICSTFVIMKNIYKI